MVQDFTTNVTGSLFLAGALMLWGGWILLPRRVGMFFQSDDFPAIGSRLHLWLWLYRVHLFGVVVSALALAALAALVANQPAVRVLVWPGAAVGVAGLIVGAIASAFYYHFGVWGALETRKSPTAAEELVASLQLTTHYVTCLVRFGRVFCGLGLTVLAVGLLRGEVLPWWVGGGAAGLGVAAMALTMLLPDNWALYTRCSTFSHCGWRPPAATCSCMGSAKAHEVERKRGYRSFRRRVGVSVSTRLRRRTSRCSRQRGP